MIATSLSTLGASIAIETIDWLVKFVGIVSFVPVNAAAASIVPRHDEGLNGGFDICSLG